MQKIKKITLAIITSLVVMFIITFGFCSVVVTVRSLFTLTDLMFRNYTCRFICVIFVVLSIAVALIRANRNDKVDK